MMFTVPKQRRLGCMLRVCLSADRAAIRNTQRRKRNDPRADISRTRCNTGNRPSESRRCDSQGCYGIARPELHGLGSFLSRSDAYDSIDVGHPDLAVTDLARGS
jgi:hypothetical protein